MKKIILLLMILSTTQKALAIKPSITVHCIEGHSKHVIELYATGHPMSGAAMFSGMMQIDQNIIHVRSRVRNGDTSIEGRGGALDSRDYYIDFNGSPYTEPEKIYESVLYRGPVFPGLTESKARVLCFRPSFVDDPPAH